MGNRETYEPIARKAAARYGFDPDIFVKQINQESGWNPTISSHAGAQGIAQIMPATAKGWGVDPLDPVAALDAAAKNMAAYRSTYLKSGLDETEATRRALAAYNAGPGAVSKYNGIPPYKETQNYVARIMGQQSKASSSTPQQINQGTLSQSPIEIAPAIDYNEDIGGVGSINSMFERVGIKPPEQPEPIEIAPVKPFGQQREPDTSSVEFFENIGKMAEEWKPPEQPAAQPKEPDAWEKAQKGILNGLFMGNPKDAEKFGDDIFFVVGNLASAIGGGAAVSAITGGLGGPVAATRVGAAALNALKALPMMKNITPAVAMSRLGLGAWFGALNSKQQSDIKQGLGRGDTSALENAINFSTGAAGALIPTVYRSAPLVTRAAANAGVGAAAGTVLYGIEKAASGSKEPLTAQEIATVAGLSGAGGAIGGVIDTDNIARRPMALPQKAVTGFEPAQARVQVTTPGIDINAPARPQGGVTEIVQPSVEVVAPSTPVVGDYVQWESGGALQFENAKKVTSVATKDGKTFVTVEGSNTGIPLDQIVKVDTQPAPVDFAVPEKPKVVDVDYTPQKVVPESDTTQPLNPAKTPVDQALYDVAVNPTDDAAMEAARKALPGYGDENIRAIADDVRRVVDDAVEANDPIPDNIAKRRVQPKPPSDDSAMGISEPPENPNAIRMKARKLRGTREEMLSQGTDGTVIRTQDDYKALKARRAELNKINQRQNRLYAADDLTDDIIMRRVEEVLTSPNNAGYSVPKGSYKTLLKNYERVQQGKATPAVMDRLRRELVDMDLRTEKTNIKQQLDELHPNVREVFETNYEPETGIGQQKALTGGRTLAEAKENLTPEQYNKAKDWELAAQADAQIKIDADTNITGATSRVAERTVTPLGFRVDADGQVAGIAYNPDGHIAAYYFTPKPNKVTGDISIINSVGEMINAPGFRGNYANLYKGVREFSVDSLLRRPPRADGLRTSEALQVAERARTLTARTDLMAENPKLAKILRDLETNPRKADVSTIRDIEALLDTEPKLLKKLCQILGKVS